MSPVNKSPAITLHLTLQAPLIIVPSLSHPASFAPEDGFDVVESVLAHARAEVNGVGIVRIRQMQLG